MILRFPYDRVVVDPSFADPFPYIFRPVVPIAIHGLTKVIRTKGILDTGSPETIFPAALLDEDEIDPAFRDGEVGHLRGADGSSFVVVYGTVDLSVRLKRGVHRWHAKVAFARGRSDILLGDAGFLRDFSATFNRPERFTTLRPVGARPVAIMPT